MIRSQLIKYDKCTSLSKSKEEILKILKAKDLNISIIVTYMLPSDIQLRQKKETNTIRKERTR